MKLTTSPSIEGIQWPHIISENTFTQKWMDWFKVEFDDLLQSTLVTQYADQINPDGSLKPGIDRLMTSDGEKEVSSFSKVIAFHPHGQDRWAEIIRDIIQQSPDKNIQTQLSRMYITIIQLVMVFPNHVYGWHTDATFKEVSGVCYVGDHGIGTTLKSGPTIKTIPWKNNRAIWFCGSSIDREKSIDEKRLDEVYQNGDDKFLDDIDPQITYHMFHNPLNKPRTIININVISGLNAMGLTGVDTDSNIPHHKMYRDFPEIKRQRTNVNWSIRVASTNRLFDPNASPNEGTAV